MKFTLKKDYSILTLIRYILYALLVFLLAEFIRYDALQASLERRFSEDSYTELAQTGLLVLSASLSLTIFFKGQRYRYLGFMLATISMVSIIREQDVYFEQYFGRTTWFYPVLVILFTAVILLIRNRKKVISELNSFVKLSSSGMLMLGFITTFVFSRLFGRKIFWHAVMEGQYFRAVKNAAEECLELYGYLLILIGIIELALEEFYPTTKNSQHSQLPNLS